MPTGGVIPPRTAAAQDGASAGLSAASDGSAEKTFTKSDDDGSEVAAAPVSSADSGWLSGVLMGVGATIGAFGLLALLSALWLAWKRRPRETA